MSTSGNKKKENTIWQTLKTDISESGVTRDIRSDLSDTIDFYLTEEQRKDLKTMGWFKKLIFVPLWLLRILFFRLTRVRRLLLALALILSVVSFNNNNNNNDFIGMVILLFILILELKDKLIAVNELNAGRAVQTAFMPEENPELEGWSAWLYSRPANSVGGDMVDLIPVDDTTSGIVLGDVSGKELGAALYMVKLQSTLRAVASDFPDLSELGSKLNTIFYRDSEPNRFATMVYVSIAKGKGEIKLLNAGHMPPILIKKGRLTEMKKGSPAIGIKSNSRYREEKLQLDSGDLLIIYSDGVTEASNSEGDFFGADRFKDEVMKNIRLSPGDMGRKLIDAVNTFAGGNKLYDDLSLVILRKD